MGGEHESNETRAVASDGALAQRVSIRRPVTGGMRSNPVGVTACADLPYRVDPDLWGEYHGWLQSRAARDVCTHPLVCRLDRIAHYGLLPIYSPEINAVGRTSRLTHSIGVAFLAFVYARQRKLPTTLRDALLLGALLHDVAHAPYSHSLEAAFPTAAQPWDHNGAAPSVAATVLYDTSVPVRTRTIAIAILARRHPLANVLFGPTGLDAIENVERAHYLRDPRPSVEPHPTFAATPDSYDCNQLVRFAQTKTRWYREIFYAPQYQLFEILARSVVRAVSEQLNALSRSRGRPFDPAGVLSLDDTDITSVCGVTLYALAKAVQSWAVTRSDAGPATGGAEMAGTFYCSMQHREIRFSEIRGALTDRRWTSQYRIVPTPGAEQDWEWVTHLNA